MGGGAVRAGRAGRADRNPLELSRQQFFYIFISQDLGGVPLWRFCFIEYPHKAKFTHARSGCGAEAGGFWYSRFATAGMFTHTRSGRGRICHFLRTMMVWGARFRSGRGKLGVGPISFAPAPPPLRDRACVNACNDLCWSQFSARPRPRPPAHVWTYLNEPFNGSLNLVQM